MALTDTTGKPRTTDDRRGTWVAATLFTRAALGAGFLSAVADRFGLWGDPGTGNVAWGDFTSFTAYVGDLAPYLPDPLVEVTAWAATGVEIVLGLALVFGVLLRWTGIAGFATLVAFGGSMFFFSGFETPLNASVFSAAAAAALLALSPPSSHVLAVDRLRG
ncbi:MauE/DoxX family redox-associated membrane protein [Nocardia asteroides]|uniref:MauE/DoxX family redox-associated membrane protein n=1 Tax=Nocardia asteroides TaxID=1824 RepID=UPI001E2E903D|nr:DoxX family membrane protein [Nocardia asteroides]UGT57481.1 DoxX family membrane protein [Nocardia asteroides]